VAHGIAAVGECMLELSGQIGSTWRMGFAGDTFNTLYAMHALAEPGRHADYVSAFGDDSFSRDQIDFMKGHGIGIASSPIIPGARPGLYAITLDGAERSFTYWRSDSAARRLADDPAVLAKSLENRELVYFSGITLAILTSQARRNVVDALAAVRAKGCHIAFDPNFRSRLWPDLAVAREAAMEALGVADIVLPTFPDEQALFGDEAPETAVKRLQTAGVGEIVVKNGQQPALICHYDLTEEVPAIAVPHPVDTTGAGDAFNGAYLAARLLGAPPAEAVRRAHRVAAAVITVRGALAPVEMLQRAFLGPPRVEDLP
jgi:2-dehydro-3-deoxygluconokinase